MKISNIYIVEKALYGYGRTVHISRTSKLKIRNDTRE